MRKIIISTLNIIFIFLLVGCGKKVNLIEIEDPETAIENILQEETMQDDTAECDEEEKNTDILQVPSKDEVLAMREKVLEGMSQEEKERLRENIKIANHTMESAYLNENIFKKLSDKDSVYWQFFDQTGDIQLGWWYNGNICSKDMIMKREGISEEEFNQIYTPEFVYNRFDAKNFIDLIEDMMNSVHDEHLSTDLQQLIDLTDLATETHDVQYANEIYKILHDLDYFLLRYGIEDVGKYVQDLGTVATYYGVLNVYSEEPFELEN